LRKLARLRRGWCPDDGRLKGHQTDGVSYPRKFIPRNALERLFLGPMIQRDSEYAAAARRWDERRRPTISVLVSEEASQSPISPGEVFSSLRPGGRQAHLVRVACAYDLMGDLRRRRRAHIDRVGG